MKVSYYEGEYLIYNNIDKVYYRSNDNQIEDETIYIEEYENNKNELEIKVKIEADDEEIKIIIQEKDEEIKIIIQEKDEEINKLNI